MKNHILTFEEELENRIFEAFLKFKALQEKLKDHPEVEHSLRKAERTFRGLMAYQKAYLREEDP